MKSVLLLFILLTSCATHRPLQPTAAYKGILPTYNHEVSYRTQFNRPDISSPLADQRAKDWFTSVGRIVRFEQQKPIRRKTDLVYLGEVGAYPLPDSPAFPPLRFWMTVDNQGDSTRVWLTNFEVRNKQGWGPMEKESFNYFNAELVSLRLADLDAMMTVMLEEFNEKVNKVPD